MLLYLKGMRRIGKGAKKLMDNSNKQMDDRKSHMRKSQQKVQAEWEYLMDNSNKQMDDRKSDVKIDVRRHNGQQ